MATIVEGRLHEGRLHQDEVAYPIDWRDVQAAVETKAPREAIDEKLRYTAKRQQGHCVEEERRSAANVDVATESRKRLRPDACPNLPGVAGVVAAFDGDDLPKETTGNGNLTFAYVQLQPVEAEVDIGKRVQIRLQWEFDAKAE